MDVLVEELVDKEKAKVVEEVNRKFTAVGQQKLEMVMDVVLDEVDKEVTMVKKLVKEVNEGLVLV